MKAHLIDTHLLVPRSKSSAKVKVKYQGHVSQKMGVSGALVFDKHMKCDENGRKFSKPVENAVGKGEIARYKQFFLFP